jgi:molybdopterin/thiamine biosynthesis adenylyltransferase
MTTAERYARHRQIPGWDQERLTAAQVIILGVGALGSEVARLLAQAGVGRLTLCDPDTVEESNLSRGALFTPADIGLSKVSAAARAIEALCPDTRATGRKSWLECGVGLAELRDATLVISCLDSRGARVELARRCGLVGTRMLDGGTRPWGGEVRLYSAGGACFGCGLTDADRAERAAGVSCVRHDRSAEAGASAAVSALIASSLAVAALRIIFGLSVAAGTVRVDAAYGDSHRMRHRRDPRCPLHQRIPTALIERSPLTVAASVAELTARLRPGEAALGWTEFPDPVQRFGVWLSDAPSGVPLRDLGVAPQEIIRIIERRSGGADRYLELAATTTERTWP